MASETTFEHVNLNEVDPTSKGLPNGTYNLRIGKVEKKTYTPKDGDPNSGEFLNVTFVVTDSDEYSGRQVYESFFPGNRTAIQLRRLMDATGVAQEDGQPLLEWLDSLRTGGVTFSAPIAEKMELDKRTTPPTEVARTRVDGWKFSPAQ